MCPSINTLGRHCDNMFFSKQSPSTIILGGMMQVKFPCGSHLKDLTYSPAEPTLVCRVLSPRDRERTVLCDSDGQKWKVRIHSKCPSELLLRNGQAIVLNHGSITGGHVCFSQQILEIILDVYTPPPCCIENVLCKLSRVELNWVELSRYCLARNFQCETVTERTMVKDRM